MLIAAVALGTSIVATPTTQAVVVLDGDGRNTTAPTGSLLTPWNLQGHLVGSFINYNATPIDSSHFIGAAHTGAGTGNQLIFAGNTYDVIATTDIANSDLRVFTIDTHGGTTVFPSYAPLWDPAIDGSEVGKPLAVFGRGAQRGQAISAALPTASIATPVTRGNFTVMTSAGVSGSGPLPDEDGDIRGWARGADDRLASWGSNVVDGVVHITNDDGAGHITDFGDTLAFGLTAGAGRVPDEAGLSGGDSSGGLFVLSGTTWKLAGVNFSVDGNWSLTEGGPYIAASIFDARGLYVGSAASHELVDYDPSVIEGSSYSTRIASHLAEIRSLIGSSGTVGTGSVVPEPASLAAIGGATWIMIRRNRHHLATR